MRCRIPCGNVVLESTSAGEVLGAQQILGVCLEDLKAILVDGRRVVEAEQVGVLEIGLERQVAV